MGADHEVDELREEIELALRTVRHDRWLLGRVWRGRLWIICDSRRPALAPYGRCTRLSPLGRRSLYERLPITVTSICSRDGGEAMRDWELDWPALVYLPVSRRRNRTDSLLVVGSQLPHWYGQDDVDFLTDLAAVVAPWVSRFRPPDRLSNRSEAA